MLSDSQVEDALRRVGLGVETISNIRAESPIKDRDEVLEHLTVRIGNMATIGRNGKRKFQATLYEIAAYAVFAALSDQGVKL